jgi:hypothetical protein
MATAAASISAAESRLESAFFGLEDMEMRPNRFHSGLMNAVVFARMVTFSLQNMSDDVTGWKDWYAVQQEEMKSDAAMKFFVGLRNEIEKTVNATVTMSTYIASFSTNDIAKFDPAPPGATSFVIGSSQHGGASGWIVPTSAGEDLYVVEIPESIATTTMQFIDAPEHLSGQDVRVIVRTHLEKLKSLVSAARERFL